MPFTSSTMSFDEAIFLRVSGVTVTTVKKACSPYALFEFPDTPATRELLHRYSRGERMLISPKQLLITRNDLYREARSVRGGL